MSGGHVVDRPRRGLVHAVPHGEVVLPVFLHAEEPIELAHQLFRGHEKACRHRPGSQHVVHRDGQQRRFDTVTGHVDHVHDEVVLVDPQISVRISTDHAQGQVARTNPDRSVEVSGQDRGDVLRRAGQLARQSLTQHPDLAFALAEFGGFQNLTEHQADRDQYAGDDDRGLLDHNRMRHRHERRGDHDGDQWQRPRQPARRLGEPAGGGYGLVAGDQRHDDQQRIGEIEKIDLTSGRVPGRVRLVDPQAVGQCGHRQPRHQQRKSQTHAGRSPDQDQHPERHDQDVPDGITQRNDQVQFGARALEPDRAQHGQPGDEHERPGDDRGVQKHLSLAAPVDCTGKDK